MAQLAILGVAALPAGALFVVGGLLIITGIVIIQYGPTIMSQFGAISPNSLRVPSINDQIGYIDDVTNNLDTLTQSEDEDMPQWPDEEHKQDHTKRHAEKMGKSPEQYDKDGRKFMGQQQQEDIFEYDRINGDTVRFNPTTGEFGIKTIDNVMRTYYKASIEYYWLQGAKDFAREAEFTNGG